jgi:CHAD domain-containing protein
MSAQRLRPYVKLLGCQLSTRIRMHKATNRSRIKEVDGSFDASVSVRLRHRVAILNRRLLRAAKRLNHSLTPAAIHDTRVAARRLRVLLRAYRIEFDASAIKEFGIALNRLTRDLGKARDSHVLQAALAPLKRDRVSAVGEAARAVYERAGKTHETAVSDLRLTVADTAWQQRLRHLEELSTRSFLVRENDKSAIKAHNRLMKRSRSRLRHAIRHARKSPARLHRVRLKVKAARYLLEDSLSKRTKNRSPELKHLRHLQDCLGDMHDEENLRKTIRLGLHDRSQACRVRAELKDRKKRHLRAYKARSRALLKLWDCTPLMSKPVDTKPRALQAAATAMALIL